MFRLNAYRTCPVCAYYASRRGHVLDAEFALQAFKRGVRISVVVHEYLTLVHERHLAGLSLSTRPWTPDYVDLDGVTHLTVKRGCSGCGTRLGDATADELEAAVAGDDLPDTRLECGCYSEGAAA